MGKSQKRPVTIHADFCVKFTWMIALLVKVKFCYNLNELFTADNKDAFRRYKGIEILVEMLRIHKSAQVTKALCHVLRRNGIFIKNLTILVLSSVCRDQYQ